MDLQGASKEGTHGPSEDDMPADLANSLKADENRKSDHTTLVQVKENEEVATLTATVETNLRHDDLETGVGSLSSVTRRRPNGKGSARRAQWKDVEVISRIDEG